MHFEVKGIMLVMAKKGVLTPFLAQIIENQGIPPLAQAVSPDGKMTFPDGKAASPEGDATSPKGNAISPEAETTSPKDNATYPEAETTSTKVKAAYPEAETTSPRGICLRHLSGIFFVAVFSVITSAVFLTLRCGLLGSDLPEA